MKVLVTLARFMLGGSETYSVTVAEQLERLGHTVTVHAGEASPRGRELAASRGVPLRVGDSAALGDVDAFDAVLAQDAESAYLLAGRRPGLRQVFVIHGLAAFEHPPSTLDPSPTVVVLNDRTARHAGALASGPPVARMRQPIDIERFRPRGTSRKRARKVLMVSNRPDRARLGVLEDVCGDLGLELQWIGASGTPTIAPQTAMAEADIVVGYGRSALEGMAMGRAAYVWDYAGGDGWVTAESYPAIEADGFAGAATDVVIDRDRLRADLAGYRPELGALGFDLVRQHHSATDHGEQLVDLLGNGRGPASEQASEALSRLVRLESRAAIRVDALEAENGHMREELRDMGEELHLARARADAAEGLLAAVQRTRSWRLLAPLRRAAALLRRR